MRLTPPALVSLAALFVAAAPVDGQERYGGSLPSSASTDDFLKSLEGLSETPTPGGYRSGTSPSPPTNELRTPTRSPAATPPSSATPPRPQTPSPTGSRPQVSSQPPASTRPPASNSYAPTTRSLDQPTARSNAAPQSTPPPRPRSSASSLPAPPSDARFNSPAASSGLSGRGFGTPSRAATPPSISADNSGRGYSSSLNQRNASSDLRSRFDSQPTDRDQASRERSLTADDNTPGPRERRTQEMLEKMLRRHSGSRLGGTPMTLASVISTAPSREEQSRRVEAYWALTSSVADYYLGLWEADELRKLRNEVSTFSQPLGQASTKLATRIDTSLKAARSAQYQLARLMGSDTMPLPSDTPFTGPYATRFDSVFATGAPAEAMLLRDLLPLRLAELQDSASDLAESEDWVERVRKDPAARRSGEGVLKALKLNALTRRAFVQLARDYNLQINRYTQLAAPELVDTGRLVAMLIRTPSGQLLRGEDAFIAGSASGLPASANRDFRSGSPARR